MSQDTFGFWSDATGSMAKAVESVQGAQAEFVGWVAEFGDGLTRIMAGEVVAVDAGKDGAR